MPLIKADTLVVAVVAGVPDCAALDRQKNLTGSPV